MAHSTHTCVVCGKVYDYCATCMLVPQPWKEMFDKEECNKIFDIMSLNGTGGASAQDTYKALQEYDLDGMNLQPSVKKHWEKIKAEGEPVKVDTPEKSKPVTYTNSISNANSNQNSNKKKKW